MPGFSWSALGSGTAILIGLLAFQMQLAGMAPLVLAPLTAGALLGGALLAWSRVCQLGRTRWLLPASLALSLVTVATMHVAGYREYRRAWYRIRQEQPAIQVFRPAAEPKSLFVYLRAEGAGWRLGFWMLDAALLTATTGMIVATGVSPPAATSRPP